MMVKHRIICGMIALSTSAATSGEASAQGRVFAKDSAVSINLPASFIPAPLNEEAVLQFADTASDAYVIILLEPKVDLTGWNLTRHSWVTAAQIVAGLDHPVVAGPIALEIGSNAATQYEIRGSMQGTRVAYVNTSIESPDAFAQVLAWTTGSQWDANQQTLKALTASVQLHAAPGMFTYDIRQLIAGTWAWDRGPAACEGPTQRFELAPDRKTMKIHHSEPITNSAGETTDVTNYVVEGGDADVLHTYIPGETRLDDNGNPVKWDLVLIARNRIAWHRADWPEGATTGMLRRCADR